MSFSYKSYNRMVLSKLLEIVPKKLITFALSSDPQRRRYFWERLGYWPRDVSRLAEGGPVVWVHANAIGEVLASRGLLHDLKAAYPRARFVLTTMNFDGDSEAEKIPEANAAVFLPYDYPSFIERAMKRAKPRALLVLESDWWPNLVKVARGCGVPVAGLSVAFRPERPFYDKAFPSGRAIFENFSFLAVQSEEDSVSFAPLVSASCEVVVAGSLKADRRFYRLAPEEVEGWRRKLQLEEGEAVVVAGSIREPEEALVLETFARLREDLGGGCLIVAPRYMNQVASIMARAETLGLSVRRASRLPHETRSGAPVLVLDTYGDLHQVYSVGKVAVIGGSLVPMGDLVGGQNPLEPATHGVPTVFGPNMDHFRSLASLFLARGAAREARGPEELLAVLREIILREEVRRRMASAETKILEEQAAVTERTVEALRGILDNALKNQEALP